MKILITGGASGLGAAITHQLATNKENEVYFTYHSSVAKADTICAQFSNTSAIRCDFGSPDDVKALCKRIPEMDPDVLIHNAYSGSFIEAYFHKTTIDDFHKAFQLNILPLIEITQAAITVFRKKKSGKILTVLTSALSGNPPIGTSVYVATKAYLQELTRVWAVENAKFNIVSNSVSPAFMLTPFTEKMDERLIEQIRENQAQRKFLQPEEVARTVESLCSAGNQQNGVNLIITAGSVTS